MESSIAVFLMRQLACEQLPTPGQPSSTRAQALAQRASAAHASGVPYLAPVYLSV